MNDLMPALPGEHNILGVIGADLRWQRVGNA